MSFVVTWIVLAAFWMALSGFTDVIHLTFGAISVTLVSLLSHRHFTQEGKIGQGIVRLTRTLAYAPWLLWQIVLANGEVIACVIGLKKIEPSVVRIRPKLHSAFGLVTLANSITLTPGTVTVDVEGDTLVIHALTRSAATAVEQGDMEARVRRLEGDPA